MVWLSLCAATAAFFITTSASASASEQAVVTFDEGEREALVEALEEWTRSGVLGAARTGVHVVSLSTGEEIYSHGADQLLNPASNIKLVTAAAALELLGPEYRFKTEIWVDRRPDAQGVVQGNVYIKGYGDPSFDTERMARLTLDLWHLGVRRVTGDLIVDETFFDGRRDGPGWEQEDRDRAYMAPVGALSLNRNAVAIRIRPGPRPGARAVVTVDPESDYFEVENRVITGSRRARLGHRPESIDEGDTQRIVVRGVHPINRAPSTHWRKIDNPPFYFAHTLKAMLGVQGVRFSRGRIREGEVCEDAEVFHAIYSSPMSELIGALNKVSNNHVAEMLLNVIGAEIKGEPGSWEKGAQAVAELLEDFGIRRGSYVLRNGSGLNDVNRVSPRQLTSLLAVMWDRFPTGKEFVVSLPVAGRDGTTRHRMVEAGGWVRAKTGTLKNVSALSGYVGTPQGEVMAFSVIVNDPPGRSRMALPGIDGVPVKLAAFGAPAGSEPRMPLIPAPVEVVPDLDERAAVYLALLQAGDQRNATYLRRAFESETDPVLRALAADALYRSDPGQGAGRLIESFQPVAEAISRIRRLSIGITDPMPVLCSIADLAAQGSSDAMHGLVLAAGSVSGDRFLEEWFSETLTEVGRTAPRDMVSAFLEMEPSLGAHALELLAEGLAVDAGDPRTEEWHPFRESLRMAGFGEEVTTAAAGLQEQFDLSALGEKLESLLEDASGPIGEEEKPADDDGNEESSGADLSTPSATLPDVGEAGAARCRDEEVGDRDRLAAAGPTFWR